MKTNELTGTALDWAVAKCEEPIGGYKSWVQSDLDKGIVTGFRFSTNWEWGGPIIEREKIQLQSCSEGEYWEAYPRHTYNGIDIDDAFQAGDTPLIAAMRCYVASKLGDEVELPEELK